MAKDARLQGQVKIDGFAKLEVKLKGLSKEGLKSIREEIIIGADAIRVTAIQSMEDTPRTGRVYRRQKGKKIHIASSPWHPPAKDSGDLVSKIKVSTRKDAIEVGAKVPHGAFTAKGHMSRHGVITLPRPWLEPAKDKELPNIKRNILAALERV